MQYIITVLETSVAMYRLGILTGNGTMTSLIQKNSVKGLFAECKQVQGKEQVIMKLLPRLGLERNREESVYPNQQEPFLLERVV